MHIALNCMCVCGWIWQKIMHEAYLKKGNPNQFTEAQNSLKDHYNKTETFVSVRAAMARQSKSGHKT